MTTDLALPASLGALTNLVHGFIYFAPEATAEYEALGLAPEQHYFASRGAALGAVPAGVIVATFYNFDPRLVDVAIPAAWEVAPPEEIQAARMRAAASVLRRCVTTVADDHLAEMTALAGEMIDGLGFEGKPLAAGNDAVAEPDDPWARFWQRITVLREWRGDVHVAALTTAPVDAIGALVLHAATDQVPRAALVATRGWSKEAWASSVDALRRRGLVDDDERFTDAGRAFREEIERRTDVACLPWVEAVGEDGARRMVELLKPVRRGLLDGGAFANMGR